MRAFEIKYLKPTDNRGSRIKVSEMQDGKKFNPRTYGYPYHVRDGEVELWAIARYLGLEAYDDTRITRGSTKVQTATGCYVVIGLV